jgi:Aldo/keto reductase family
VALFVGSPYGYRHLGKSGLKISELTYGNWITHGSQVEEEAARSCVAATLDEGITSFDTADVYAGTRAEEVLGRALSGTRRESVEIFTKVFWPTGSGPNDRGLSRKHIIESLNGSLRRLGTDYVDLYQAHRYDHETPLGETLRAFEDLVRQGKALYIGVSEWRAQEMPARSRRGRGPRARQPARSRRNGARPARGALAQLAGWRLIGPYSLRSSSSSVTWSTPASSKPRQFSPSQLSASPWLAKMASGRSPDETTTPSVFS